MKKIAVLLLLVLVIAGCGKKQQRIFTVINQSDWRVVVAVTDFIDNIGDKQSYGTYVIGERNNLRGLPSQASFHLYERGDCNLVSVNGARIKSKTDTLLVLDNIAPTTVNIINQTGQDVSIKNAPCLGDIPVDFYYGGIYKDEDGIIQNDYKPIFRPQRVAKNIKESNPITIPVYAWQLFEITNSHEFTTFAKKYILITSEPMNIRTIWEREGDTVSLHITN